MSAYVKQQIQNNIATIEFFHPEKNSLPSDLLKKLAETITEAGNNADVKVIVLKSGEDRTFCAGASFQELIAIDDAETGKVFFSGFANVINAMRKCSKPIIGRIHGKAVGGGVGLAAACDYTFATSNSAIKLSEIAIGIGPFVIEPAVSRKMGKPAFTEMTLTPAEWKTPQWAKENHLFSEVFDSIEELDNHLEKFIISLASYNPEALMEMKKVFWEGTTHWDTLLYERAAISGRLVLSDFTKEALQKFKK